MSPKKKWINTLKFLAGYLVAAWTFLQFLEWVLNRYDISPNWVDLFLWIFVGLVPSLAIYFHHQERLSQGILKLREKIIFPLNVLLLFGVLYIGFGNTDLGATTKEISYTNNLGEVEKTTITKEEFRIEVPIYSFTQTKKDTAYSWLQYGIRELIYQDIIQDKSISSFTSGAESTVDRVMQAKIFSDYYVDGSYEVNDGIFTVKPAVRKAINGKIVAEQEFTGPDLLEILDEISIYVRNNIGIVEEKRDFYLDLQIKDFVSNSLDAIKYSLNGEHEKAQKLDSTFALSYLLDATNKIRYSRSKIDERKTIDKAFKYSGKLPLQRQLEIRIRRYIAYENWELAEKLLKLQLEIDPSDKVYNDLLYVVYSETKQIDNYFNHAQDRFVSDQNIINGGNFLKANLLVGNYKQLVKSLRNLELLQPNNTDIFTFKIGPQLLGGDIEGAKKTQEKTRLVNPNWENFAKTYDIAIDYLSENEITAEKLEPFVGVYRSEGSEQLLKYWLNDDILIQYVSNQKLSAPILAGENLLVDGDYIENRITYKKEFLKDSLGNFYAIKADQFNFTQKYTFYYWLYTEEMEIAEFALEEGKIEAAKSLYESLVQKHPHHYYFKNALKHINYVQSRDSLQLLKEYENIAGSYGNRKFFMKNGKLFYKRESLPEIHLLPTGDNEYISLTRYGTKYGFEPTTEGKTASFTSIYDAEKKVWMKASDSINYLLKNE